MRQTDHCDQAIIRKGEGDKRWRYRKAKNAARFPAGKQKKDAKFYTNDNSAKNKRKQRRIESRKDKSKLERERKRKKERKKERERERERERKKERKKRKKCNGESEQR